MPPRRRRAVDGEEEDDGNANARKHDAMTSNKHDIAQMDDADNDTIAHLIPDLEDEQEDMARQVAEAPHLTKSRVQSIKESECAVVDPSVFHQGEHVLLSSPCDARRAQKALSFAVHEAPSHSRRNWMSKSTCLCHLRAKLESTSPSSSPISCPRSR